MRTFGRKDTTLPVTPPAEEAPQPIQLAQRKAVSEDHGQMLRTRVDFSPMGPSDRGDFRIVSRKDDAIDLLNLPCDFNRPRQKRLSAQRLYVLSGNRFASTPGRDDSNYALST